MENEASGDLPTSSVNNQADNESTNDTVAYSSYQKVLNERKQDRDKARAAEARLAELENQLLIAEGKKDEIIETYKQRYEKAETELKNERTQYVSDKVNAQIIAAAKDYGCVNTDKYLKLIGSTELDAIKEQIDDNYNINPNALTELMTRSKKEHEDIGLFKKTDIRIHDVSSKMPTPKALGDKSIKEMTYEEKKAELLRLRQLGD